MSNDRADEHADQQEQKPIIDDAVKKNVKSRNTWLRFFYMILFVLIMGLAEIVLAFVVIVQFFTVLISGERNQKLLEFGADLSLYVYHIWRYLCFASERQPFPFGEWQAATRLPAEAGEESDSGPA